MIKPQLYRHPEPLHCLGVGPLGTATRRRRSHASLFWSYALHNETIRCEEPWRGNRRDSVADGRAIKRFISPCKNIPVEPERDAYGQEIWNCYRGNSTYEIAERDDGFIEVGSAQPYFDEYGNWPEHEREAIERARSNVLDIGCGGGRVALYLQQKGIQVLAIDNSPLAVKVSKLRGVKAARVLSILNIETLGGPFHTIVMYGNNFGLFGGIARARRLLAVMHKITSSNATILAASSDPYKTRDPVHLAYHQRNRERGRMGGQVRVRIRYRQFRGDWFDYLFASAAEVHAIVARTGWIVKNIVPSKGPKFMAILEKEQKN
jgi:SAM-dependent methyltransferase